MGNPKILSSVISKYPEEGAKALNAAKVVLVVGNLFSQLIGGVSQSSFWVQEVIAIADKATPVTKLKYFFIFIVVIF